MPQIATKIKVLFGPNVEFGMTEAWRIQSERALGRAESPTFYSLG
jgi:hypothetical protein